MTTSNPAIKAIRSSSRNTAIFSFLILLIVGAIGVALLLPYGLGFLNTTPITKEQLINNSVSLDVYGADVTGELMLDTGYYYEYTYAFVTTSLRYYGALLIDVDGDENPTFLLIEQHGNIDEEKAFYVGRLTGISSDINNEIIEDIYRDEPSLRGSFLPVMLTTVHEEFFIGLAVFAVIALASLVFFVVGFSRLGNPLNHPSFKALAPYGNPETLSDQIASEMVLSNEKVGKLSLTRNWAVRLDNTNFNAQRYDAIVWIHKFITTNKSYGITTSKVFEARIHDKHGNMLSVADKEPMVDEMLKAVAVHAPHAYNGYHDDLNALWLKNRQTLIDQVEKHKRQLREQSEEA